MNKILVEVSVGELFDKISILEIKKDKIKDKEKLKYIISTTFKPIEVFIVAGGIYLFMTFIIHNFIRYLEKKYSY